MNVTDGANEAGGAMRRADAALRARRCLYGAKREHQRNREQRKAVEGAAFGPDRSSTYPVSTVS
jgi:hypothetical protein